MEIFIDESGNFEPGSDQFCCTGALAIPTAAKRDIADDFKALKAIWGLAPDAEVKGSELNESQTASVLSMLARYNALFDVCVMLMADSPDAILQRHQIDFSVGLVSGLNQTHTRSVYAENYKLAALTLGLSSNDFAKYILCNSVLKHILQSIFYFAPYKYPSEMSTFKWYVDAMHDQSITKSNYESLFESLVTHLFLIREKRLPQWEQLGMPNDSQADLAAFFNAYGVPNGQGFDLKKVLTNYLKFPNSETYPGLQLVDIAINTFSRAIKQNMGEPGWSGLGALMIKQHQKAVLVQIPGGPNSQHELRERFTTVLKTLSDNAVHVVEIMEDTSF